MEIDEIDEILSSGKKHLSRLYEEFIVMTRVLRNRLLSGDGLCFSIQRSLYKHKILGVLHIKG